MYFQERSFSKPVVSDSMSQGMFRAFLLLLLLDYLDDKRSGGTLLVDDLGEGLDYQRATQLGKVLLDFLNKQTGVQLIATSNDSFLMDVFPIEYCFKLGTRSRRESVMLFDSSFGFCRSSARVKNLGWDRLSTNGFCLSLPKS